MSADLRNKPIDRRRLTMEDRADYNPSDRLTALNRAKQFKAFWAYDKQRRPFTSERSAGTGGFTSGLSMQQDRNRLKGFEKERAESFRPQTLVTDEVIKRL